MDLQSKVKQLLDSAERHRTEIAIGVGAAAALGLVVYLVRSAQSPVSAVDEVQEPAKRVSPPPPAAAAGHGVVVSSSELPGSSDVVYGLEGAPLVDSPPIPRGLYLAIVRDLADKVEPITVAFMLNQEDLTPEGSLERQRECAKALSALEHEFTSKYNLDFASIMRSQQAYTADADIQAEIARIRKALGLQEPTQPEMSAEEFLVLFCRHIEELAKGVERCCAMARELAPRGERATYARYLIDQHVDAMNEAAMAAVGLTDDVFMQCSQFYGQRPAFVEQILRSKRRQEEMLRQLDD